MKKTILFLMISQCLFSQTPAIQWQKCLGGSNTDNNISTVPTSDGGYLTIGYTRSTDGSAIGNHGNDDILAIKLNSSGEIVWNKILGGSSLERVFKAKQTSDGGYIICGFTYSNDGDITFNYGSQDAWVVKLDATGNLVWQKTYGGTSTETAYDVLETSDGYIVSCETYSNNGNVTGNHGTTDAWLIKINASGTLVWQKTYGGSGFDNAVNIQYTSDGGYVFAGITNSNNGDVSGNHSTTSFDYWVVKISSTGTLLWQKCFGGSSNDEATSIEQTTDGGYIVSGYTSSSNGDVNQFYGSKDYWILKLNSNGTIQWKKTYGGSLEDYAYKIRQTTDGGFIVTGYTGSNDFDVIYNHATSILTLDIWVLKLDTSGEITWQKSLGSNGYQDSRDIIQTSDGGFIVSGNTGGNNSGDVSGYLGGNLDYWIVKLGPENLSTNNFNNKRFLIYPNPSNHGIINIQLNEFNDSEVFGSIIEVGSGKTVKEFKINNAESEVSLDYLANGIYIVKLVTNDGVTENHKLIISH